MWRVKAIINERRNAATRSATICGACLQLALFVRVNAANVFLPGITGR